VVEKKDLVNGYPNKNSGRQKLSLTELPEPYIIKEYFNLDYLFLSFIYYLSNFFGYY
jgi:hypothetical protein